MEFKKERNLIVGYDEIGMRIGAWDILTGNFIGKNGSPIKSVPRCFTYDNLPCALTEGILGYAIYDFRRGRLGNYDRERGCRLEQLLSLNLYPNRLEDLDSKVPLKKDLVKYLKENCASIFSTQNLMHYVIETNYKNFLDGKPEWVKYCLYRLTEYELPVDFIKNIVHRCYLEHVEFSVNSVYPSNIGYEISRKIKEYYDISIALYDKVEVKPNFLTMHTILSYLMDQQKNKHYNEMLNKNNNKSFLYFENDTLFAAPILTKNDFHFEGESQHNCVERCYMEKVFKNETYIVSIRRKDDPDNTYITCEVTHNKEIRQYLTKWNRQVIDKDGQKFLTEYLNHLKDAQ